MRNAIVGTGSTLIAFAISMTWLEQPLRIISLVIGIVIGSVSLVRMLTGKHKDD